MRKITFIQLCALFAFCAVALLSCNDSSGGKREVIRPPYLVEGDSIGIMTLSSALTQEDIIEADTLMDIVRSWGFKVRKGESLLKRDAVPFSTTDKERAQEFMKMVKNPNLKGIIFYRGGYGAIRTMEYIDFEEVRNNPKWILGFSDVTTLHLQLSKHGIESIHGPMLSSFWKTKRPDSSAFSSRDAFYGKISSVKVAPHAYNKLGSAQGRLIGGNLTLISTAEGTPYQIDVSEPSILFIEDVGEGMNTIDRYMQQLEKSGKLALVKGVIIGGFTRIKDDEDPWGISVYEMIKHYTDKLNVPVAYGFPAGHMRPHKAIYFTRTVTLNVTEQGTELIF